MLLHFPRPTHTNPSPPVHRAISDPPSSPHRCLHAQSWLPSPFDLARWVAVGISTVLDSRFGPSSSASPSNSPSHGTRCADNSEDHDPWPTPDHAPIDLLSPDPCSLSPTTTPRGPHNPAPARIGPSRHVVTPPVSPFVRYHHAKHTLLPHCDPWPTPHHDHIGLLSPDPFTPPHPISPLSSGVSPNPPVPHLSVTDSLAFTDSLSSTDASHSPLFMSPMPPAPQNPAPARIVPSRSVITQPVSPLVLPPVSSFNRVNRDLQFDLEL